MPVPLYFSGDERSELNSCPGIKTSQKVPDSLHGSCPCYVFSRVERLEQTLRNKYLDNNKVAVYKTDITS